MEFAWSVNSFEVLPADGVSVSSKDLPPVRVLEERPSDGERSKSPLNE